MPSRDVQILRRFTQKLAGHSKQANPLMDPKVLGMLGGGALTGLGAYGLARSLQSDEDRERGSYMPMLAGLAGAGAGAYGGSYLPQLLAALRGPDDPSMTIPKDPAGYTNYNAVAGANPVGITAPKSKGPAQMPLSAAPKRNFDSLPEIMQGVDGPVDVSKPQVPKVDPNAGIDPKSLDYMNNPGAGADIVNGRA